MPRPGLLSVPLEDLATFKSLRRLYRDRLTSRGRRVVLVTAALAVLGVDTRRSQTFLLFGVAFALILVSSLVARFTRARAKLEASLPSRATAGRSLPVRVRVVPEEDATGEALVTFRAQPKQGLTLAPREIVVSLAGDPVDVTFELRAERRGRYELEAPTLRALDPFGLAAGRARRSDHVLLVYPRFFEMERFDLPLGRRHQPGGIPLTSSTGDAVEFIGTRDYRPGDLLRNVHWRSWARRGTPVVKEYQEEYFCRIAIVLDTFSPSSSASFEAAISVVASIADHFSRSEYVVDVLAAGPDLYRVSAGRSLAYLENILDVLACIEPSPAPPFETIAPTVFEELAQITTVVAVLLDWDDKRSAFLQKVRALGTEVRAIVVRSDATTLPTDGETEILSPEDVARALEGGRS